MKKIRLIVIAFIIVITSGQTYATNLWDKASFGMTINEVKKIYPDAMYYKKPETMGTKEQKIRCKNILKFDHVNVGGYDFTSNFCFRNNKLQQILLVINGKMNADQGLFAYEHVRSALLKKYGNSYLEKTTYYHFPSGYQALSKSQSRVLTWLKSNDVQIKLLFFIVTEDMININIVYQNPKAIESKDF